MKRKVFSLFSSRQELSFLPERGFILSSDKVIILYYLRII